MKNLFLILTLVASTSVSAITINEGDSASLSTLFTSNGISHTDNTTGLEWLDFSNVTVNSNEGITLGHSINTAEALYSAGGWHLATETQLRGLFNLFFEPAFDGGTVGAMAVGEDPNNTTTQARNSWLFSFGTNATGSDNGLLSFSGNYVDSLGMYVDDAGDVQLMGTRITINPLSSTVFGPDYQTSALLTRDTAYINFGVFMVRDISAVPIPAAAWLFMSGLIGLVGVARRKA